MNDISKTLIGQSGRMLTHVLLTREGLDVRKGEKSTDLIINLERPKREFSVMTTTNLKPKKAGGKGKYALDWWVPKDCEADFVACSDLESLRVWIFRTEEIPDLAQQQTSGKYHLYMYTDRKVALRGKKDMKFDYEFESFRLENRVYRKIFTRKKKTAAGKSE
ncbi:MAG: hypothetical protein GF417_04070 [Candidatus Latescibacteria bacterium]|nr:hypothetical protein [bacterium]MBD3423603.1 hypothetical protein [Candidatus Latescibacterota bacterium]